MSADNPFPRPTHRNPLGALWRFFGAPSTLAALVVLLACALVLVAVVPQLPAQTDDPQAWLALHRASGLPGELLVALGLHDLYHAFWFSLLLALIGVCLSVRTVDSVDLAWRAGRGEGWQAAGFVHWGRSAPRIVLPSALPAPESETRIREALTRQGYHSATVGDLDGRHLVAGRRPLALWSEPLVFGAALLALVGLAVAGLWGWQSSDWWPALGESLPVGHGTPYAVRFDAFELQQDGEGRLLSSESVISWLQEGQPTVPRTVGPRRPATLRGIAVRQVGYSPVVRLRGQDSTGHDLVFQLGEEEASASGEIEITFRGQTAQPVVLVYGHDAALAFAFEAPSREGQPALYVTVLDRAGTPQQPSEVLHRSGPLTAAGLQLELSLEFRPILRLDYRPLLFLVLPASVLLLAGLALRWLLPAHLLWIVLQGGPGDATRVSLLALPCARARRWPWKLAATLREVLHVDA